MACVPVDFPTLKLYAIAIQNAHILASEMDFANLQLAFKMTCELQQRVVDLMSERKRHLTNLEALVNMKRKDTHPVGVMEMEEEVSQSRETELYAQQNHYDENQNSEVMRSENIENGEAMNDNQHLCELSNQEANNTEPPTPTSQTSSMRETLTPSTSTSEEACKSLNNKHKLISIESLREVMLLDGVPIHVDNDNTDCITCRLRNHVQTETIVTMVCAACSEFPRLCSAQCFRWWHMVHLPAMRNKPRTVIESEQSGTTISESNNQVVVSELQAVDGSSEFKPPEKKLVLQPSTAPVRRRVGKRKRRKGFRLCHVKKKVISVWPVSKSCRPPKKPHANSDDPQWRPNRGFIEKVNINN